MIRTRRGPKCRGGPACGALVSPGVHHFEELELKTGHGKNDSTQFQQRCFRTDLCSTEESRVLEGRHVSEPATSGKERVHECVFTAAL